MLHDSIPRSNCMHFVVETAAKMRAFHNKTIIALRNLLSTLRLKMNVWTNFIIMAKLWSESALVTFPRGI